MRCRGRKWFLKTAVIGLALGGIITSGLASEDQPASNTAGLEGALPQEEQAPLKVTEGNIFLGYRFVSTEDDLKAAEYTYPDSAVVFGLNLLSVPIPYRFHINGELISKKDYYLDGGFASSDVVLFRNILTGVRHNLPHYYYLLPGEADLSYDERDPDEEYYINYLSNLVSLRLKTPDFPFHAFVNHRHVDREGSIQQRFMLGYFGDLEKVSESREINWKSEGINLGANSHLGPVELEYAYDTSYFDSGKGSSLYDTFPDYTGPPARPVDIYPHNVIADTESSAHSVKLHSSYTGAIVAAATFSTMSQKNNYSMVESTTRKGAFDLSWIPDPVIGLFLRYRHTDMDMDTPGSVTLSGLSNDITYPVRQNISYGRDVFTLASRYNPLPLLTLSAQYEFLHLERKDEADWEVLSDRTDIHKVSLKANARPVDKLKVTAKYEFVDYDQPSYNTTPDRTNKVWLTANYTPSPLFNIYLKYILGITERDSLIYLNSEPYGMAPEAEESGERDGRYNQFLASLTSVLSPKASLSFSWFYQRLEIEQDLAYGKWSDTIDDSGDWPYIDSGVPYTDQSNTFSLALHYIPWDDLSVTADVSHTIAESTTGYSDVIGGAPFSLPSYSDLEVTETSLSFDIEKKLNQDWEIRLRSKLGVFNDKTSDFLDGNVFTSAVELKRYF